MQKSQNEPKRGNFIHAQNAFFAYQAVKGGGYQITFSSKLDSRFVGNGFKVRQFKCSPAGLCFFIGRGDSIKVTTSNIK